MTQLSKRPLKRDVQEKILGTLFDSVLKINHDSLAKEFIEDFLTPTEKLMLAKRLTAAYFIERGYSYRFISEVLKLSPSTVSIINRKLMASGDGYRKVFNLISKSSRLEKLLEKLDTIFGALIPPIKGSKSSYRR